MYDADYHRRINRRVHMLEMLVMFLAFMAVFQSYALLEVRNAQDYLRDTRCKCHLIPPPPRPQQPGDVGELLPSRTA